MYNVLKCLFLVLNGGIYPIKLAGPSFTYITTANILFSGDALYKLKIFIDPVSDNIVLCLCELL